ncbi:MAG: molybdopterin molybdotransferase MoeA [Verrucomicrobiales bacterium]
MKELVSATEAAARWSAWARQWKAGREDRGERVSLLAARGRVLASPVVTDRPLPPYDRVMMDGVAVRADDWQEGRREFRLGGTQAAGSGFFGSVQAGEAVEVMTGGVCPGAPEETVVVPVEFLEAGMLEMGRKLRVVAERAGDCQAGRWIHRMGADAQEGDVLIEAGAPLGAAELGILASCGLSEPRVRARVRVAVLTTGDELVAVTESPEPHQIRRSNDVVMAALAYNRGAELVASCHVGDERQDVTKAVRDLAGRVDVVAISGGASMGRRDFVAEVLSEQFGEPLFHGVRQRPGKPFGMWDGGRSLLCALPGNPVSVLSCLCRHLGPLLTEMAGEWYGPESRLLVDEEKSAESGFHLLRPVRELGAGRVALLTMKNSGDFASLAGLAGFVDLNSEKSGQRLDFYPL